MSLARAEGAFQRALPCDRGGGSAVVIAVAPRAEERLRLAQLIGDHASVVLVGTRAEAIAVLLGEPPGLPEPSGADVRRPAAPAPVAWQATGSIVDSDLRVATWEGRSVPLSPLEHDLLCCLLAELGHTWPFEALHRQVWGNAHLGDRSDVQSVVKRLRRKLRELDCPTEIHAVRGVGLRLVDRRDAPGRPADASLDSTWTSTRRTTRGSPGSRPARCRSRRRPRGQRARWSWTRRAPATTTAWRWRSSPSCRCAATRSTTCSCRTPCWRRCETRSPTIVAGSADLTPVLVVGAPLVHGTRVLNCAVVIHRGRILGVAPKSYLPNYREFYERRCSRPATTGAAADHARRRARCRSGPT